MLYTLYSTQIVEPKIPINIDPDRWNFLINTVNNATNRGIKTP